MHLFDANPNHKLNPNPNPNPNQVVVNKAFRLKKTLHDSYAACDSYAKELSIFLTQLCWHVWITMMKTIVSTAVCTCSTAHRSFRAVWLYCFKQSSAKWSWTINCKRKFKPTTKLSIRISKIITIACAPSLVKRPFRWEYVSRVVPSHEFWLENHDLCFSLSV